MSKGWLRLGLLLALPLAGADLRAQAGEKVSVPPVTELEKEKLSAVDSSYTAIGGDQVLVDGVDLQLAEQYVPLHDSSAVVQRNVPTGDLDGFRNDPAYQYDRVETGGPTLWDLFWRWVDDALFRPLRENTSQQFWAWFWLIAGICAIAFVITRALRADSGWFIRKKDEPVEGEGLVLLNTEDIETVDLEALLAEALRDHRYRDAARYQYLRALQSLTERGLIDWDRHKTNREYLVEVRRAQRPALNGAFSEITSLFEWIWYGEFPVDEQRFALVRERFDRFSTELNGTGR